MNTTLKFDRVILVKELNEKFKKVGDTFEIANVLDNSFVLRDANTRTAIGVVNFEDFDHHFVHEENFKGWTNWTPFVGFDGHSDVFYRTNRKKTQVKFLTSKVRAESCCSKVNEFNLAYGVQMAYLRCLNKANLKKKAELENELKIINNDIAENETILKKMVNSLEV